MSMDEAKSPFWENREGGREAHSILHRRDVRQQDFQLTKSASLVLGLLFSPRARRLSSIKHCTGHGDSRPMLTPYRVTEMGGEDFDAFLLRAYDPHMRSSFAFEIGEQRRIFPSHNSGSRSPKPVN